MSKNTKKIICRCEEITEEEIREAIREGYTTIKAVKRRTRAGMGLCQGRTCSTLIRDIIAEMTGVKKEDILPDTVRSPLYPVELDVLGQKKKDV
ncbi:MAG TPA: (2Fe-2S)-binding protein [Candidatus Atribacteria bacterium]|jgi:NAD(P)H-nitrite reductase large subunit|nr:(2Fe-2S)-binding protein [Candidatus Atribacteria bacterium]